MNACVLIDCLVLAISRLELAMTPGLRIREANHTQTQKFNR
jgi:hypothetical protein